MNQQTLGDAVQVLKNEQKSYGIELSEDSIKQIDETFGYGMSYNTTLRCNVPIEKLKGKNTRKYFHVIITRLDNGLYEPIGYVL